MPILDYQGSNADVDEFDTRNQEFVDANQIPYLSRNNITSHGDAVDTSHTTPDESHAEKATTIDDNREDVNNGLPSQDVSQNGTGELAQGSSVNPSANENETFFEDKDIHSDALGEDMSQEDLDREREALTHLRRLSMQGTDDPDLHTDWSVMMSPPESESDASTLFWVPADLHPEVNPNGWKDFLDLQVKNLKHPKQMDTTASPLQHIRSLHRRRSLLSRQVKADDAAQSYQDGSPIIEKKNIERGRSLRLQDLEHLESLARDPKKMGSLVDSMRTEPPEDSPILVSPNQFLQRSSRTTIRRSGASIRTINRGKASTLLGNRSHFSINKDGQTRSLSVLRPSSPLTHRHEQNIEAPSAWSSSTSLQDKSQNEQNNNDTENTRLGTESDVIAQISDKQSKSQENPNDSDSNTETKNGFTDRFVSLPEQSSDTIKPSENEAPFQSESIKDNQEKPSDSASSSLQPSPVSKPDASVMQSIATPTKDNFEEVKDEAIKSSELAANDKGDPIPKLPSKPPTSAEVKKSKKSWGRLFTSNDPEKDLKKDKLKKKGDEHFASQSTPSKDSIFGSLFSSKKKSTETSTEKPVATNVQSISHHPPIPKEEGFNDQRALSKASSNAVSYVPNADKPKALIPDKDYYWSRFPICTERAIYRLSHIKLSNAQRPLMQQVLLSNFMYSYLDLISRISATRDRLKNTPRPGGPRRSEFSAENVKNELENLSYHFGDQRRRSMNRRKPSIQQVSKKGLKSG
ncbi:zds family protein phosphatase type A regulator Zds1 [Schizosaccharomyces cryophilus OY26]|uniref:Zds family protein phosphatase type A regulator Zds1 n=1 Tax=Schizosaccharomyces cryophilus (strain OY26 / ATCC MYA-4695 / CBS 11777 / NBRC 106824 / NRRL Y48691) TaxID=653667 RepID=S9VW27_SCHCR|nr:zds family protein phosphatase type A regulator Zds1 [Schizosaccharomyces cryophilus OY26]EPY50429.1 zds family protein phosphatase type A regulator Zds1 [Schizosaccharomyces cryophilus OY26]